MPTESSVWPLKILEIPNPLKNLEYVMPIKRNKNKTFFCISSQKLLVKCGLQYSHWVVHLVLGEVI